MSVLESIILGIIQGITEFLPVSSSGHIELGRQLFSSERLGALDEALFFIVMVHVATLLPIVVVFRKDVVRVLRGLAGIITCPGRLLENYRDKEEVRLAALITIGTIPTVIVALVIKRWVLDGLAGLNSVVAVAFFFFVTSLALLLSDRLDTGTKDILGIGLKDALFVGIVQGIAVFPGISRSGATICASLATGMKRPLAARFSFLLSIPVILAAACYESVGMFRGEGVREEAGVVFVGTLAAAAVGFPALMLVLRLVQRGKLGRFAYYLVPLGVFSLVFAWWMSGR